MKAANVCGFVALVIVLLFIAANLLRLEDFPLWRWKLLGVGLLLTLIAGIWGSRLWWLLTGALAACFSWFLWLLSQGH